LDEKEIGSSYERFRLRLNSVEGRLILKGQSYIDIDKNNISLIDIGGVPARRMAGIPRIEGLRARMYPSSWSGSLYKKAGDDVYSLVIHAYYRREGKINFYKKAYLRSYKHTGENFIPICELDISECLMDRTTLRMAMRLINNSIFAFVNDSYFVVDATNPEELKLIDKKLDVLKKIRPHTYKDRKEEFDIPLVPVEGIGLQERIKLSIDLNYRFYDDRNEIYESSIVDIHDGKIAFSFVEHDDIARYDVIRWDDEKVYCRFSTSRPFTILEFVIGKPKPFSPKFVKNGKLYCYDDYTLLVFDIRSNRRIRKLGHFVRMDYNIEDMEVLEDGNILLCTRWDPGFVEDLSNGDKYNLYLLKTPE